MKNRQNNKKTKQLSVHKLNRGEVFFSSPRWICKHRLSCVWTGCISVCISICCVSTCCRMKWEESQKTCCVIRISQKNSWCLRDVHWPSVSVRHPDSTAVIHVFSFPLLRWALPPLTHSPSPSMPCSSRLSLLELLMLEENAYQETEMDQTIPPAAAAARTILHVCCWQPPHYPHSYLHYYFLFLNISTLFSYFVLRIKCIALFCILKYFWIIAVMPHCVFIVFSIESNSVYSCF